MAVATSMRRPTARAVGSVAVATTVANVCSYLVHLPAGRWLAPSGYGEFAVLLQVILLLSVPAVAVQSVIAREVVRGRDLAAVLRAATWTTLGVAAVSACAVPIVAAVCATDPVATAAAFACAPLLVVISVVQGVYQGRQQFTQLAWMIAGVALARTVPAVVGLAATRSATGAFVGFALGTLVAALLTCAALLRDDPHLRRSGRETTSLAATSPRVVLAASQVQLVLVALTSVDLLVSRPLLGEHEAGLYALGTIAAKIAFWLPQAVGVVFFPRLAVADRSRDGLRVALGVVGVIGLVVVGASVVAAPLVDLLFGDQYRPITGWLWLFALAGAAQALVQVVALAAIATDRTWVGLIVWAAVAVEIVLAVWAADSAVSLAVISAGVSTATAAVAAVAVTRSAATVEV